MAAIQITINPDELRKVVLESVKQMVVPVDTGTSKEELMNLDSMEVREILGIGQKALDNLITSGILNPVYMGNGFKFPLWKIKEFQKDYEGHSLNTLEECVQAREKVQRKKP